MPQRLIDSGFWSDPDPTIECWSREQRLAFLYLLTHPQSTPCGIWRVSPREAAMHLNLRTPEAAKKALGCLEPKAFFDPETCYVCIPAYPKWQCKNPKTGKPAAEVLRTLPKPVVAWLLTDKLAIPYQTIQDTVSIRYVYHPEPDTEPDTEPVPDKDRSADPDPAVAPATPKKEKKPRPETIERKAAAERIVLYHAEVMEKTPIADKASVSLVEDILRQGFTEDQCRLAVDGCKASDFHMGQNKEGQRFNGIRQIFKDGDKTKSHIERAEKGVLWKKGQAF